RSIARSQADVSSGINLRAQNAPQLYTAKDVLSGVDNQTVIDLLMRMDKQARKQDPRVKKVVCSLVSSQEEIMVAATDGIFATDIRPMVKLSIQVICVDNKGRMEMGYAGGGGRILVSEVFAPGFADIFVADAVRGALINLQAKPAPAGVMPVVLAGGWPGVLLHEAVGHGLEGDFNRKGSSAFAGKIGQQVAAKGCTVIDSGIL